MHFQMSVVEQRGNTAAHHRPVRNALCVSFSHWNGRLGSTAWKGWCSVAVQCHRIWSSTCHDLMRRFYFVIIRVDVVK